MYSFVFKNKTEQKIYTSHDGVRATTIMQSSIAAS